MAFDVYYHVHGAYLGVRMLLHGPHGRRVWHFILVTRRGPDKVLGKPADTVLFRKPFLSTIRDTVNNNRDINS